MALNIGASADSEREYFAPSSMLSLCGETPIVALPALFGEPPPLAKLEKFNPAGSIKDRVAAYIIDRLERENKLNENLTIVESSSGNLGIGLAMLGAERKIRVIIVVDPNTSKQNIAIMRAYGAEVVMETQLDEKGLYHRTKLARAKAIAEDSNGYWVNQTANQLNAEAHEVTTGAEIVAQCGDRIDFCLVATSSGGQVAGISRALQKAHSNIAVVAVDVVGSQIFSAQKREYLTPGLGLSWQPVLIEQDSIDYICLVDDAAAFESARYLAQRGLMVGPSSGALAAAAYRAQLIRPSARVLCVFPDGGERYLNTLFDDTWMHQKGFETSPSSERIQALSTALEIVECHRG